VTTSQPINNARGPVFQSPWRSARVNILSAGPAVATAAPWPYSRLFHTQRQHPRTAQRSTRLPRQLRNFLDILSAKQPLFRRSAFDKDDFRWQNRTSHWCRQPPKIGQRKVPSAAVLSTGCIVPAAKVTGHDSLLVAGPRLSLDRAHCRVSKMTPRPPG
jgi:hypothetical protein